MKKREFKRKSEKTYFLVKIFKKVVDESEKAW